MRKQMFLQTPGTKKGKEKNRITSRGWAFRSPHLPVRLILLPLQPISIELKYQNHWSLLPDSGIRAACLLIKLPVEVMNDMFMRLNNQVMKYWCCDYLPAVILCGYLSGPNVILNVYRYIWSVIVRKVARWRYDSLWYPFQKILYPAFELCTQECKG